MVKLKRHPNFSGGAIPEPRGYKLIYVGKAHHLAMVNGYAYEHRLVAEKKLGRRLRPGEVVHHRRSGKEHRGNNQPRQLKVYPANAAHLNEHRTKNFNRRRWNEPNPEMVCGCGCGKRFSKFDSSGRPRRYAAGCSWRKGKKGGWK